MSDDFNSDPFWDDNQNGFGKGLGGGFFKKSSFGNRNNTGKTSGNGQRNDKEAFFWLPFFLSIFLSIDLLWQYKNSIKGWAIFAGVFLIIVIIKKLFLRMSFLASIISWSIIFLVLSITLSFTLPVKPSDISASNPDEKAAQKSLDSFFDAKTLHIKGMLNTTRDDGTVINPQKTEIWKKGEILRVDYELDGENARTLIVRDGKATFYSYKNKKSEPAVVPADYYMDDFKRPPVNAKLEGKDQASGGMIYQLDIEKLYNMKGAQNKWYVKDKIYCVGKDRLLYIRSHGNNPHEADKPTKFDESTTNIEFFEVNKNIDDSTFNAPF